MIFFFFLSILMYNVARPTNPMFQRTKVDSCLQQREVRCLELVTRCISCKNSHELTNLELRRNLRLDHHILNTSAFSFNSRNHWHILIHLCLLHVMSHDLLLVFFSQGHDSAKRAALFNTSASQRLHFGTSGTPRRRTNQH